MKKYRYEMCGFYGRIKKILFVMKLTILAFFLGLISLSASTTYSQNKKISLGMEGATLLEVIKQIESQSEFVFIYKSEAVNLNKRVNVKVEGTTVDKVLENVLQNSGIKFEINNKQIILTPDRATPATNNEKEKAVKEEMQQPQKKEIRGSITDAKGVPLPGATVMVKGTTVGTITDNEGKFTLNVPVDTKILSFSFVGMVTQEISLTNQSNFKIVLKETTFDVGEVVVVGYGVQKKQSVVGSIAQTNGETLKRSGGVTDLRAALTGNLPGVTTITSTGEPGGAGTGQSATSIFIRGQNTWNGGQPLILVDGAERNMDNIDVNEVETISVLKDASATAVFGVKGADGVILITTKRGTIGKPKITFSYNTTAKVVSKLPQKLDAYNTFLMKNEAIEREVVLNEPSWADYKPNAIADRYKLPQPAEYATIYPNINWQDALFAKVSMSHHANMSISGGTNSVSYFGSFAYLHEGDMFNRSYDNHKGYQPSYGFDRFNFRSNLDFKLTNTTNFTVDLAGYYGLKNTDYEYMEDNNANPRSWIAAYGMPPDAFIPQFPDGTWGQASFIAPENMPNPVASIYNTGIRENRQTSLNTNFSLTQKLDFLTKGLSAKASLFYDNLIYAQGGLYDVTNMVRPEAAGNTPYTFINSNLYTGPGQDPSIYTTYLPTGGVNQFDWAIRPWTINQETIIGASTSTVPGIYRRLMYQFQLNWARKYGLHNLSAMGLVKRDESATGNEFKHFREDWVSRVTYDYNAKYLLEANGAYNGSEQFGPGYRFGFFPSMAAGWVISNEKFFKLPVIDRLKIRATTGKVGNDNVQGNPRWLYMKSYSYGGNGLNNQNPSQPSTYTWYKEGQVANPNARWETAQKNDIGIEMGLFKELFSINYDYFNEDRTNMLIPGANLGSIPPFFGATPPPANLGHVKAHGYELEVKFDKRTSNDFRYWATFAVTHTINQVISKDDPALLAAYSKVAGFQTNQTKSQIRTGFYNNWDQIFASTPQESNDLLKLPGFYNIADFNGDGLIKSDDAAPTGYPETPQNTFATSLGAEFKGFSFMVQFYGVNNVTRNIPLKDYYGQADVLFEHVLDHWSKDNPTASSYLPRWKTAGQFIGDYWLYDGSYIRLKTAELAYTFRGNFVKRVGLSALKLYLNGENLLFWSHLPDDREAALTGGNVADGAYPSVRRINLGIDITF